MFELKNIFINHDVIPLSLAPSRYSDIPLLEKRKWTLDLVVRSFIVEYITTRAKCFLAHRRVG